MINLQSFTEDYAPLLLRVYPKSVEQFIAMAGYIDDRGRLQAKSMSAINRKIYKNKKSPWNATDKKAKKILMSFGLLTEDDSVKLTINPLTAMERFQLYWSNNMYENLLDALEDDILRRKAYKEAIDDCVGSPNLRSNVIERMGLDPVEIMQLLNELKVEDEKRYVKIVSSFKEDEETIQASLSRMKIFKGDKPATATIRIPRDTNLQEVVGLNGYRIPDNVTKLDDDSYWLIRDISYCREKGHLDQAGNVIPVDSWNVFQFIKLFLDEYDKKFGANYPGEADGVLMKKELDAPASLRKGKAVWKKRGNRVSRLFKDIKTVMTAMKNNQQTKDYIEWWFTSGIIEDKNGEYTSGWLQSPSMITAFFRVNAKSSGKNSTLSPRVVEEICSLDGFVQKNHNRIPETINDIKLLVEQCELFESDDPRKRAVEICRREGII